MFELEMPGEVFRMESAKLVKTVGGFARIVMERMHGRNSPSRFNSAARSSFK